MESPKCECSWRKEEALGRLKLGGGRKKENSKGAWEGMTSEAAGKAKKV